MEKEFVPYELAVKLKSLGFDEPCFMYWYKANNGYVLVNEKTQTFQPYLLAPLFQQAFRWIREKYEIYYVIEGSIKFGFQHFIYDDKGSYEIKSEETFKNYEEAELACLTKLIEIVEQQNQIQ